MPTSTRSETIDRRRDRGVSCALVCQDMQEATHNG